MIINIILNNKSKFWILVLCLFIGLIGYYLLPETNLKIGQKADKIIINKANHELLLYENEDLIATYKVSLGRKGLGKKTILGDNLTPEGRFLGKKRGQSEFYKAISIGEWGECCGVLIHGQKYSWVGKFQRWMDWTEGCIALTNNEMDEIYAAVSDGVIIEINP
ncbi:MAG: murein L,D-transpeptidase family protein [Bacteroidota bacterium]